MDAMLKTAATNLWQHEVPIIVLSAAVFVGVAAWTARGSKTFLLPTSGLSPYLQFAYNNFLKPHDAKAGDGQQSALESFYARQVGDCARLIDETFPTQVLSGWHLRHYPKAPSLWP